MENKTDGLAPLRVLCLEDSPRDAELISELLLKSGRITVDCAATEREFRSLLASRAYDAILTDFSIPGFDGFASLRLAAAVCPEVPVICVSGTIGEEAAAELIKAGAADYVLKDRLARLPIAIERAIADAKRRKELKQAQERGAEQEAALYGITTAARDAILLMDNSGNISFWNPAAERMLGWKAEEILGKSMADRIVPERFREAHKKGLAAWRQTGEGAVIGKMLELAAKRKDGAEIPVELSLASVKIREEWCAVGILRDITARKRVEAEQQQLREQFLQSQKMEAVGQLAGGVAHDFNNILTAIQAYAEFIRKALPPEDPMRSDAQEILNAANRAAALTRQLLAFSRRQIMAPKVTDLNKAIGDMTKMLRRIIGEDIQLSVKFFPAPCLANVDLGQMEQVIMNLAVNARDAVSKGGAITLETEILIPPDEFFSARPGLARGKLVCVRVRDNGCGMSAEVKSRLFEPFFTTKGTGKGSGLGLSTAFGIVKQSGGEIAVESEPGKGTSFCVYLPLAEACLQDKDKDKDKELPVKGHETVLFVEDEETLRRLGERVLRAGGYAVLIAADGQAALKLMEERGRPADLLITDVVMPGMSGRELALELARRKLVGRVLYTSGYTDNAIVKHGVLEPGIAFIYKPYTVDAMLLKLREVLDGPVDRAKA